MSDPEIDLNDLSYLPLSWFNMHPKFTLVGNSTDSKTSISINLDGSIKFDDNP